MSGPIRGYVRTFAAAAAVAAFEIGVPGTAVRAQAVNVLTDAERAAGWRLLFDGRTLNGWMGYDQGALSGWAAADGALTRIAPGGDIITEAQFADFELSAEWKVEAGGNSGIFYRAARGQEWIYHSAPEMQVLDDARHRDGRDARTSSGSNYGLHAVPRGIVKPAGEWNHALIRVRGNAVEHWLNGVKVVEYVLGSPEWVELVRNSKFAQWPAYGRSVRGHIGLQDHGDPVYYRNIKVRELR